MQKTLGGDRLGSGKKQKIELHGYERSTHDLSYIWRSTMAPGTLVPFMSEIALPGDTFDIDLDCIGMTHPTIGPLFGSYKIQLDVFQAPIRLYNSLLHNNMLGIGLNMSQVKLPTLEMNIQRPPLGSLATTADLDNTQINPSCILSYLGIRGLGYVPPANVSATVGRAFNAVPLLAYWEIYKNYYANKQEEIGAVIHTPQIAIITTVDSISIGGSGIDEAPIMGNVYVNIGDSIAIFYTGTAPLPSQIILTTIERGEITMEQASSGYIDDIGTSLNGTWAYFGTTTIINWRYATNQDLGTGKPSIVTFPLSNIDDMRLEILAFSSSVSPFTIQNSGITPYSWLTQDPFDTLPPVTLQNQEGLGLKTYQSDLFNNWLQTEWIDGVGGISEITSIDTTGGSFAIDTLILAKKVYNMLNRIAVSGGTYDDWLDAVYTHDRYTRAETPMYMGGLSKELIFQEVVSNSASEDQPLGTLAGRGVMSGKHKGGKIVVKVDEPSYIIGIISITPRLDYSQGNKWDTTLKTLDDLHKPALDEIGFQELITEQMAWWDTNWDGTKWVQKSAGKQPAWMNYMTNVNQTRGNFAIPTNEMFMTLNRRYEVNEALTDGMVNIKDLTTYIDPTKYNNIFAETSLDAQNFWMQIAVDITARRKMSAKVMPNL